MGIIPLGGIKISRSAPKLSIRIVNNLDELDSAELFLQRVGVDVDFVAYTPSRISEDYVEFTFDELLFVERAGKYKATFKVNDIARTVFYIVLESDEIITVAAI